MLFHCEAASIYICVLIRGVMRSIMGTSHRDVGGCLGIPQGDSYKILTRHKEQIFTYRIGKMANVKFPHLKIGPDIDLVCPTSSIFTNIVMTSKWMSAIRRPCSIQSGRAKPLSTRLCACRLFRHPALTKINC